MTEDDLPFSSTDAMGGCYKFSFFDPQDISSYNSRRMHPTGYTNHKNNQEKNPHFGTIKRPQGIPEQHDDNQKYRKNGQSEKKIRQTH